MTDLPIRYLWIYLGGCCGKCFGLPDVVVSADLPLEILGGFLADGSDLVVAVVVVHDVLHFQNDGSGLGGKSGNTNLKDRI